MDVEYSQMEISYINFAFVIVIYPMCFHPHVIGVYISEPANIVV